jgi:hypothetical protein
MNPMRRQGLLFRTLVGSGAFALVGCATVSTAPTAPSPAKPSVATPSLGLFSKIKVPAGQEPALRLAARGAQVFRCETRDGANIWVFRQPDAELLNERGQTVGRHGANQSFEHVDGSRLTSTIVGYDLAPRAGDLRWLLLATKSFGKGTFDGVTYAQRVNTAGGMPPERCDKAQLGQVLRVDFTAEFVFYRPAGANPA